MNFCKKFLLVSLAVSFFAFAPALAKSENANEGNRGGNSSAKASPEITSSAAQNNLTKGQKNWQNKFDEYKAAKEDQKLTRLEDLAKTLIENRITFLTNLKSQITSNSTIDEHAKATILAEIDKAIADLQSLKTDITKQSDLNALKDQVKSIYNSFKVYEVLGPKELGLSATAQSNYILGRLEAIERQLQSKIEKSGVQSSEIQALVSQINEKLADAKAQLAISDAKFKSMTPANTAAAKQSREEGKAALKLAKDDLKAAHDLMKTLLQKLRSLTSPSPQPSTPVSPAASPEISPELSPSPLISPTAEITPSPEVTE